MSEILHFLDSSSFRHSRSGAAPQADPDVCPGGRLGEYGATRLAETSPGKTATVSQRIAMVIQDGDYLTAGIWTVIVILIAIFFIFPDESDLGKALRSDKKRW